MNDDEQTVTSYQYTLLRFPPFLPPFSRQKNNSLTKIMFYSSSCFTYFYCPSCKNFLHPSIPIPERKQEKNLTEKKMKGTSKVIMGATLVMVVTLAIVLGLVLVLLAELYCSLLLRRRRERSRLPSTTPTTTTTAAAAVSSSSQPKQTSTTTTTTTSTTISPLSSFCSHGVLNAPRNILFPREEDQDFDIEKQKQKQNHHSNLLHFLESHQTHVSKNIISSPPLPKTAAATIAATSPSGKVESSTSNITATTGDGKGKIEHFVYISNPIYDNEFGVVLDIDETPFETPDTSPSRLESSGDDDDDEIVNCCVTDTITPPLSPMKALPKEGCSVTLRDAGSLGTSGSDSNNNGGSSSSSGSPCTSPSW